MYGLENWTGLEDAGTPRIFRRKGKILHDFKFEAEPVGKNRIEIHGAVVGLVNCFSLMVCRVAYHMSHSKRGFR